MCRDFWKKSFFILHLSALVLSLVSIFAPRSTKPFYIPFRALMVGNASNLLVAGKSISQTFHSNGRFCNHVRRMLLALLRSCYRFLQIICAGATRLHPSEWSTGVAAAGAAVLMVQKEWSTLDAYNNVQTVRAFLNSSAVGQPLLWKENGDLPPLQTGWTCELQRCIGVDFKASPLYPNNTCDTQCQALADDEWLANMPYWSKDGDDKIIAIADTKLKKSTANSQVLPDEEVKNVPTGTVCTLVTQEEFEGYALCKL